MTAPALTVILPANLADPATAGAVIAIGSAADVATWLHGFEAPAGDAAEGDVGAWLAERAGGAA